jgi:(1->4)-alpha-D-glucan 1-alpha-D-glucosylmutase
MTPPQVPCATYRLQFNRSFTFQDAGKIIPYLHRLGISHVYASPFLKARAGSPHGYDIVDHNALNPEIGDESDFANFIQTLHHHDMGLIFDMVPNHMGVGGDDNGWWLDVLENGEASRYAGYFDIDWHPVNPVLHNKILLPFLGDHYGTVLERGELKLGFDTDHGSFGVRYYEHLFPIDPRSYGQILSLRMEALKEHMEEDHETLHEYIALLEACQSLPRRTELSTAHRRQRRQGVATCKERLAGLVRSHPEIIAFVEENVARFNGIPDQADSFDLLHHLLEAQAYRLAYWQVASDEINYRRFFDINSLAGLRMENSEVFEATHRLVGQLIEKGQVNGLRIDHPDGLSNPYHYCCRLQQMIKKARGEAAEDSSDTPYPLWVEKILASYERLPGKWPVAGTTGYESAYLINGLFIYSEAERSLSRLYRRFTGRSLDFDELLYERKKLIIRHVLTSELTVLANLLMGIAQANRHTRDFTYYGLRDALGEIVACFPVYRTYITHACLSSEDERYVQWAVAQAKKRSPATDILIFDFIHAQLLLNNIDAYPSNLRHMMIQFTLRFQQYTAPVMAKGMEDTAFYIHNRLISLNDVGFDPRSFGLSLNAFHHENKQRQADWPLAMVTTSTHDSKRGEDVRARIDVISEVADTWQKHLARWGRINRRKKRLINHGRAPSRNDEYLFYQTLLGAWPLEEINEMDMNTFSERIHAYMQKAIKEAKLHTSWINPNQDYEAAMNLFVHTLLDDPEHNAFLSDFIPLQKNLARYGLYNSLSQTLLKLTIPGIPDIYQGNELWAFNLVDPDNRRSVDYERHQAILDGLIQREAGDDIYQLLHELLEHLEDGRAKLYVTWIALNLRQRYPELFIHGEYKSLSAQGTRADHVCAFTLEQGENQVIVAAARWFARLLPDADTLPVGRPLWDDTWLTTTGSNAHSFNNVLSHETVQVVEHEGEYRLNAADLFGHFPLALLSRVS